MPALSISSDEKTRAPATWILVGKASVGGILQRIPITTLPFQIGRKQGGSLCLPVVHVSKQHAEIFEQGGSLRLRDLGSTNGTYVNGKRVEREVRLADGDMLQFASEVFRLQFDGHGTVTATVATAHCDRAMLLLQLDRLLVERQVEPHFQPIVSMCDDCLFGYEILGRSRLFGLEMPTKIFEVAAMFDLEPDVSELFRSVGLSLGSRLAGIPNLFVNTHPTELGTPDLIASMGQLRELYPDVPLTLEIHEAAVTSPAEIGELRAKLRDLNVGLAYDDFGAGQSRLLELIEIPPDFIKFDMGFIRNIDTAPTSRRNLLQSLVRMVQSLGIASLAEGVETAGEAQVCHELAFDFAQGYFFGRPQAISQFGATPASTGGRPTEERT
jgi:EAL domain-containing protein (putative c-di-GMP-specific phosphodiesterase class I)